MILLLAIGAGFLAGYLRARLNKRRLAVPDLRLLWLVIIGFFPQLLAFQIPATSARFPEQWIPIVLVSSFICLLIFTIANLRQPGFWILGIGLILNFLVITTNGGWMPISPETVQRLAPNAPSGAWEISKRLGITKDIVKPVADTKLWFLSDRFTLTGWVPYHVAFSIGDIFIALGAFWFLWSLGGPGKGYNSEKE